VSTAFGNMAQAQESSMSPEEQQEKWLDEATAVVKQQSFLMKRALDNTNLKDALKYSSNMLCELRTGLLTPKNYYELYMLVMDELRHLEQYFYEEWKKGRRMVELYELVQHAGNIVPRLYLLTTVGSVYIKSKEAPARDILKDLVEMCRGVQHPMRGLFLRNYLLQLARDKLPDIGSEYGEDVKDSIDFLMQNFTEMNKLWVRMQHQGPVRDRDKREKERLDLRILVGMNLVRLSQLDGVDAETYKQAVLPRVMEQVMNCKDQIAQQYLMECLIQVFPDEFHLRTLEQILNTCTQLQAGVDIKSILISLMDRLASFAKATPDAVPENINIFDIFHGYVAKVTKQATMDMTGLLGLQVALLNFALNFAPDRLDYVDNILGVCAETLGAQGSARVEDPACTKVLVQLLCIPMESYKNVLTILNLSHYPDLIKYLTYASRKQVAVTTVRSIHRHGTQLNTVEQVDALFSFIGPLVKDQADQPDEEDIDMEDFEEEQNLVASLVHYMSNDDTDLLFKMYSTARKHFGTGGARRIKRTLVPLVFRSLQLASRIRALEEKGSEPSYGSQPLLGKFCLETVTALGSNDPNMALRLFLQCAQQANNCGYETITYEFFTQAFILYEDEISDSKMQMDLIGVFVGVLGSMTNLTEENYDPLITKTTQYAAKLLKKPDQCRAIYRCSHLFWNTEARYTDAKRVLDCLQRSLKIADVCMQASMHVNLFVEILNQYLYYFDHNNDKVTIKYLQGLINLINENIDNMDPGDDADSVQAHYANTKAYMAAKMKEDPERYALTL